MIASTVPSLTFGSLWLKLRTLWKMLLPAMNGNTLRHQLAANELMVASATKVSEVSCASQDSLLTCQWFPYICLPPDLRACKTSQPKAQLMIILPGQREGMEKANYQHPSMSGDYLYTSSKSASWSLLVTEVHARARTDSCPASSIPYASSPSAFLGPYGRCNGQP